MAEFLLRATRHDLMRVMEGHPVTLENNITLRLYTAAELMQVTSDAQDVIGMAAEDRRPLSADQLRALTYG